MSKIVKDEQVVSLPTVLFRLLDWIPHEGNLMALRQILPSFDLIGTDDPGVRFWNITASRRMGKTALLRFLFWRAITMKGDFFGPPFVAVIADTHEHANKVWDRILLDIYSRDECRALLANHDRERERLTFKGGAVAQRFSGDNPAALSGEGVTVALPDEAQFISDEAMSNFIPSITERRGIIIAAGVAENDGGWFSQWEDKGDDPYYTDYGHIAIPWYYSPFIPEKMVEMARRELGEEMFSRRYMAVRPQKGESLWPHLHSCIFNLDMPIDPVDKPYEVESPQEGHRYVGGLDVARVEDYTVLTIFDYETGKLVYFHRLTGSSIGTQAAFIAPAVKRYAAHIYMDATGLGIGAYEIMRDTLNALYQDEWDKNGVIVERKGGIEEVVFTNKEKQDMVEKLAVLFEFERIKVPNIVPMIRELHKYQKTKLDSGALRYAAPNGYNDDCVSSLLLAGKGLRRYNPSKIVVPTRNKGSWEYM